MFEWPQVDWNGLRTYRRERVRRIMRERRTDHLLLTGFENLRYVLDYRSMLIAEGFDWFAAIANDDGEGTVFVPWVPDEVENPDARQPWIRRLVGTPSWTSCLNQIEVWVKLLEREIRAVGARRVGIDALGFQMLEALRQALPGIEFVSVHADLERARQIKQVDEIRLIEAAGQVNSIASAAAIDAATEGVKDFDVLAAAMAALQGLGVEYVAHSLCITRGSQLAGSWFPKGRRLWEGDPFFFDIGCYGIGGYASDMARTAFVGEPAKEVRKAYAALLNALGEGLALARPGVRASQVFQTINKALRQQGFAETPYSVGHGIGLRTCEEPILYRREMMVEDATLEEGMTIAIEPETTVESRGTEIVLKIEDSYAVEKNGLRRLTPVGYGPGWTVER